VSEGPNAGVEKWRPDAGASVSLALEEGISLALDQRQRWECKIRLPDASASVTPALEREQKWAP
jgi:hypothetical protein